MESHVYTVCEQLGWKCCTGTTITWSRTSAMIGWMTVSSPRQLCWFTADVGRSTANRDVVLSTLQLAAAAFTATSSPSYNSQVHHLTHSCASRIHVNTVGQRQLRSATLRPKTRVVRRTYSNYGDRCFAAAGPKLWNSLPAELRQADNSFQRFKRLLFFVRCWDRGALLTVKGRNPHKRTSWKLVGNPGHELVTN